MGPEAMTGTEQKSAVPRLDVRLRSHALTHIGSTATMALLKMLQHRDGIARLWKSCTPLGSTCTEAQRFRGEAPHNGQSNTCACSNYVFLLLCRQRQCLWRRCTQVFWAGCMSLTIAIRPLAAGVPGSAKGVRWQPQRHGTPGAFPGQAVEEPRMAGCWDPQPQPRRCVLHAQSALGRLRPERCAPRHLPLPLHHRASHAHSVPCCPASTPAPDVSLAMSVKRF